MKTQISQTIIVLISLFVFLSTGQVTVQGYVWCLGDDGHSALESPAQKECKRQSPESGQDHRAEHRPEISPDENDHGSCLDVSASLEAPPRRDMENGDLQVQVLLSSLPDSVLSPSSGAFNIDLYPQPPPRINQSILMHRTIVLLN